MSIEEKYTSQFAQNYREKLAMECDGKTWTPSVSSIASSNASDNSRPSTPKNSANRGTTSPNMLRTTSSGSVGNRSTSGPSSRKGKKTPFVTPSSADSPRLSESSRSKNEEYFARLGEENEGRRNDLPPSQGGKYTGFGNTPSSDPSPTAVPDIGDLLVDPVGTLSKGWSLFTLGASSAFGHAAEGARSINNNVLRPATEQLSESVLRPTSDTIRDPDFQDRFSGYVSSLSRTVQDTSSKGFSFLSDYLQSAPSTQKGSQNNDRVSGDEKDQEGDGWGHEDDDYAAFGNTDSEKFQFCKDDEQEERQEESEDAWKSTNYPVSGASSSTRFGSSTLSSKKGTSGNTVQRKTRTSKNETQDDWGGDDEWSKF